MPRAFSSGAASIASYALNSPPKRSAPTFVSAAVSVVLPWSTWPIVPTFTWGLVRSNLPFAMAAISLTVVMWCSRMESNHRPPPYQGGALPTELREQDRLRGVVLPRSVQWSGRRESNPHHQLGRLRFYH